MAYAVFDWAALPADSKILDIGGGIGTQMVVLARNFEHLNLVVQEREAVCIDARKVNMCQALLVARNAYLFSISTWKMNFRLLCIPEDCLFKVCSG